VPLIALERVSIAYGHLPLLDEVQLQIEPRERVAIIGRNGTGKSTLLKILSGEQAPDGGSVWRQPALKIPRHEQDIRPVSKTVCFAHTRMSCPLHAVFSPS